MQLFSAPGKLLLAGGYLVLWPEYSSLSIALSSRMHATVSLTESTTNVISIDSPQFQDSHWSYQYEDGTVTQLKGSRNPFIETTIKILYNYLQPLDLKTLSITIFSDLEFHSQQDSQLRENGFRYHSLPIEKVAKTGLGSSASLVTVLTTSILSQFINLDLEKDQLKIHNLAQISHCLAQGKIGSGFDVASATFGSIIYRRFKPSLIETLLDQDFTQLQSIVDSPWEFGHEPFKLPPKIKLIMGDISGGSNTPKLVSKVLKWREDKPELAQELFTELNKANMELVDSIQKLNLLPLDQYEKVLKTLSTHTSVELMSYSGFHEFAEQNSHLLNIIKSFEKIRTQLRKLGRSCEADIEPFTQTRLLNNCNSMFKGCLGGVVPGAGGFDAICLLVHEDLIAKIKSVPITNLQWLDLVEQFKGVCQEDPAVYRSAGAN